MSHIGYEIKWLVDMMGSDSWKSYRSDFAISVRKTMDNYLRSWEFQSCLETVIATNALPVGGFRYDGYE